MATLSAGAQTVTLTAKDVSLRDIFTIIKKQTGILFFYDAALLDDTKPVTIELKNATLETALNEIFKGQGLSWILEDKTVTILKYLSQHSGPVENLSVQHPPGYLKGIITDEVGNPVSGVSVLIKGTKIGTASDEAGKFTIAAKQNNTLVFSSISYSSKEVRVTRGDMNIVMQLDLKPMEALLVGGNMNAIKRRADVTSVTVLDSKTLEKIPANTLDQVFRGWVPGANNFNVGPEPEGRPALSIRGAAGPVPLAAIAVYVDGIEYAGGSLYLSQLDKTNIDRIEIVKGPGAATLYGTGSNGGIIQIFTKKPKAGQTSVNVSTAAGFYKSKWVEPDAFQQMHTLETSTGFKNASLTVGGSYRTIDAYLPEGGEKNKGFYSSAKLNFGKLQANISGRYNVRNFHSSRNPIYDTAIHPRTDIIIEPLPGLKVPAYIIFNVRPRPSINRDGITETYVTGINLSHKTSVKWTNNLDAGYTANNMKDVPKTDGLIPLQSFYTAYQNKIITLRYFNVLRFQNSGNDFATTITSGAEYKKYSSLQIVTRATLNGSQLPNNPDNENYGGFVQLNPSYKDVYLTMGLRYEKNNLFKATWNPRIGLTTNFETAFLIFKPRISWGKGITAPSYLQRFGQPANSIYVILPNSELKAQSQEGFDYGLELYDRKGKFKFEAGYYDNLLKDMIAEEDLGSLPGNPNFGRFMYKNVGEVANRGWEFLAEFKPTRFNIRATFSIMNSTLADTTGIYYFDRYKDKPPGTRLGGLPRHTAGLLIDYQFYKLFGRNDKGLISLNATELGGIKYFDGRNYFVEVAYGRAIYEPGRSSFDTESKPVFRVGLYVEYNIVSDLRFFILGSNILNDNKAEVSTEYSTHGATWLFGLKYQFLNKN
ncbi:TonB-dependent receptor plug domain-containing protein [Flavitalea sp.]|nr:TonB-dependent receptor plug domain-containing protein [Flavitalea sp.]